MGRLTCEKLYAKANLQGNQAWQGEGTAYRTDAESGEQGHSKLTGRVMPQQVCAAITDVSRAGIGKERALTTEDGRGIAQQAAAPGIQRRDP